MHVTARSMLRQNIDKSAQYVPNELTTSQRTYHSIAHYFLVSQKIPLIRLCKEAIFTVRVSPEHIRPLHLNSTHWIKYHFLAKERLQKKRIASKKNGALLGNYQFRHISLEDSCIYLKKQQHTIKLCADTNTE